MFPDIVPGAERARTIAVTLGKALTFSIVEHSTRLSIVEHALADVVERLAELPPTRDSDSLRELARQYVLEVERWGAQPPDESRRVALLRHVLDLNVDVIRAGARPSVPPADTDHEDDYPKPVR